MSIYCISVSRRNIIMELQPLRCALHGISAYKHLMDQPVLSLALSLLDHLAAGHG